MKVLRVLRGETRNQSTADFSRNSLFVFGNRYYDATVANKAATEVTLEEGVLVMRDAADTTKVLPIVATADLAKVIGVVNITGSVVLATGEETNACYAHRGEIDGGLLVLPETSTLNTLVGDATLKDLLTEKGFVILNVSENSKFDN